MRGRGQRTSILDQEKLPRSQKKAKPLTPSKLPPTSSFRQYPQQQTNMSACSISPSNIKQGLLLSNDPQFQQNKIEEVDTLGIQYFLDKYLLRDQKQDTLKDEMIMLINRKNNQIQSLRVYRDQLRFISRNQDFSQPVKMSLQVLKGKAEVDEKLCDCRALIEKELRRADRQAESLYEYQKFLQHYIQNTGPNNPNTYIDTTKQQQVLLRNLQQQKQMLVRQLAEEQRKNSKQVKQIQDQILQYRIMIKDKQDTLRNLKAKICTLYIKLHSRNHSRSGSKSKDRNMSLSIRKFNIQNHNLIKEAYVGNNTFKSYSKEIIEKVGSQEELVKIKFFMGYSGQPDGGTKNKEQLYFQCFYKGRDGQLHDDRNQEPTNDQEATRDKISSSSSQKFEEVYVKHLFSIKFFYKSKIVGVECRIKTDKGNKHIYIGNCSPQIEHELLTLVNKKIVTLGSYWHGKQMIGISVWYSDRLKTQQEKVKSQKNQAYDEYYS